MVGYVETVKLNLYAGKNDGQADREIGYQFSVAATGVKHSDDRRGLEPREFGRENGKQVLVRSAPSQWRGQIAANLRVPHSCRSAFGFPRLHRLKLASPRPAHFWLRTARVPPKTGQPKLLASNVNLA